MTYLILVKVPSGEGQLWGPEERSAVKTHLWRLTRFKLWLKVVIGWI